MVPASPSLPAPEFAMAGEAG
ncbi:hypothetical protein CBM2631_B120388 [Cupriavidus taiwanensis]|nr:hypothetical protein CBM2617_U10045 [Cupriavidus taiwanensis]SPA19709.1 hypothetical protein CBM2631_B120388 [Cupriavidus taiwanensis]SPA53778.1 hypothetical protein CBM2629_U10040 [Cupriavidus taiwanensis]